MKEPNKIQSDKSTEEKKENEEEDLTPDEEEKRKKLVLEHEVPTEKPTLIGERHLTNHSSFSMNCPSLTIVESKSVGTNS
jgi:hypothetical protein